MSVWSQNPTLITREETAVQWPPSVHALGKVIIHVMSNSQVNAKTKLTDGLVFKVHSSTPPYTELRRAVLPFTEKFDENEFKNVILAHDVRTDQTQDLNEAVVVMDGRMATIPCQLLKLPLSTQNAEKTSLSSPVPMKYEKYCSFVNCFMIENCRTILVTWEHVTLLDENFN